MNMISDFNIKENGKPQVKLTKRGHFTTGFMSDRSFVSKENNLFINETKIRSNRERPREFIVSIRAIGDRENECQFRLTQMHFDEDELKILRDNIDKILEYKEENSEI